MKVLKKFIKYYSPYKTVFFLDLFCATIISLIDLAYPQILRTLTNTLFARGKKSYIKSAVSNRHRTVSDVCDRKPGGCSVTQGHMMGARMEKAIYRQQLFDHYEKLSFSYYDHNNSGQMMSKLVSDLFDISEFAHHGPENLFISLIKIIGSFTFLFLINWRLAMPMTLLVAFMLIFSVRQNKRIQRTFMENRKKIGDVNASLQDTLAGIRVVQSFANEKVEQKKFRKSNHAFLMSKDDNYKCMGSFMSWNLFSGYDVPCDACLRRLSDCQRHNASRRPCHVCALYRYFYKSDTDSCRAYGDDAKRPLRLQALYRCDGNRAGH